MRIIMEIFGAGLFILLVGLGAWWIAGNIRIKDNAMRRFWRQNGGKDGR